MEVLRKTIRIDEIQKRAKVKPIVGYVTKRQLSWYGHIELEDITRTVLDMDILGKRPNERS